MKNVRAQKTASTNKEGLRNHTVQNSTGTSDVDAATTFVGNTKAGPKDKQAYALIEDGYDGSFNGEAYAAIASLMDCDTTGIEPATALVSYKLLAGKGNASVKMVNQTVREALYHLGYSAQRSPAFPKSQIDEILAYIEEHDTIEGAPHLKEEHLAVFDCAFKPAGGERFLHYMGHLKMMAAVQPFVWAHCPKRVCS